MERLRALSQTLVNTLQTCMTHTSALYVEDGRSNMVKLFQMRLCWTFSICKWESLLLKKFQVIFYPKKKVVIIYSPTHVDPEPYAVIFFNLRNTNGESGFV